MQRKATAVWKGGLKDGQGTISGESRAFRDLAYDFRKRFESDPGTNPEELIAAAHAGCFSMALSGELGSARLVPESIRTTAAVTLEMLPGGPTVTAIHLDVVARVPGADRAAFEKAAGAAKDGCPISRLLGKAATITLSATLE
jgi:osmotically inducible protein OsmC